MTRTGTPRPVRFFATQSTQGIDMDHDVKFELPPNTMLIKATKPEEQGPCVMINTSDFDPKTQEEYIPQRRKAKTDDGGEDTEGEGKTPAKSKAKQK
jgi:hypothetical protein